MVFFVLLVDVCCFGGTRWEIWISVATSALVTGKTPGEDFERLCGCINLKPVVTQACHHQSVFMLIVHKWTSRTCSKRCAVLGRLSTSPPTSPLLGRPFLILQANIGDLSVSAFGGRGRGTLSGPDEAVNVGAAHGREQCCSVARVWLVAVTYACLQVFIQKGLLPLWPYFYRIFTQGPEPESHSALRGRGRGPMPDTLQQLKNVHGMNELTIFVLKIDHLWVVTVGKPRPLEGEGKFIKDLFGAPDEQRREA